MLLHDGLRVKLCDRPLVTLMLNIEVGQMRMSGKVQCRVKCRRRLWGQKAEVVDHFGSRPTYPPPLVLPRYFAGERASQWRLEAHHDDPGTPSVAL
jgi:hypothetical protein